MRAIAIDRFGGPEVLYETELPTPAPGPGEVLVEVAYAGVNPADWKCREGWLARFFEYRFPFVLGFDLAGVIVALGPGVSGHAIGDRVAGCSKQGRGEWGSYAQYAVATVDGVARWPAQLPLAQGAALATAGITAFEGVFESGRVGAGQSVLVHGGAGGVGSYAIQLARHAGARVAATCGPHNLEHVRSLGAERAIDHRAGRVAEQVLAWAPDGVDLVLDAVGQGSLPQAVQLARSGGVVAPIATLVDGEPPHDATLAQRRGVRIVPTMSSFERAGAQLRQLVALCGEGVLRAPPLTVLPLAAAAQAQRRVQDGHVRGKIVLEIAGERV